MPAHTTLFVGLGSSHGDDRVGWLVADALEPRLTGNAVVRRAAAPLDILDWLDRIDCLALCDACRGMGPVGTWQRWRWPFTEIPAARARHSHDVGLSAALLLTARLGQLPREVVLWGIEIGQTEPEQRASPDVTATASAVADDVASFLCLNA
jgi:hydrogenase maturation protease